MDIYQDSHPETNAAPLEPPRHRLLEDIARELSSDVVFPTSFDTVTRLHAALEDPEIGLAQVGALITVDPLVSARVLALANSTAYNPAGDAVQTLPKAIERLGLENVRMVALALLARQMLQSRESAAFRDLGTRIWAHSLHTASAAYVLARKLARVNADEALLAGLIHDIGACYMIYRGAHYEDLVAQPDELQRLLTDWHESIGHTLAIALGLPQKLADAILDQDGPRDWPEPILSLADVVYVANLMAGGAARWQQQPLILPEGQAELRQELFDRFGADIDAHHQTLTAAFA